MRAVLVGRESRDLLGGRQPLLVDVVERQLDLTQLGEREQVTHEVACELDGPGPYERHSEHVVRPYRIDRSLQSLLERTREFGSSTFADSPNSGLAPQTKTRRREARNGNDQHGG